MIVCWLDDKEGVACAVGWVFLHSKRTNLFSKHTLYNFYLAVTCLASNTTVSCQCCAVNLKQLSQFGDRDFSGYCRLRPHVAMPLTFWSGRHFTEGLFVLLSPTVTAQRWLPSVAVVHKDAQRIEITSTLMEVSVQRCSLGILGQ